MEGSMEQQITRTLEVITTEAQALWAEIAPELKKLEPRGEEPKGLLMEARPLVPHGQWEKYLSENFPRLSPRKASRIMKAEREGITVSQISKGAHLQMGQLPDLNTKGMAPWNAPQYQLERRIHELHKEHLNKFEQRGVILRQ